MESLGFKLKAWLTMQASNNADRMGRTGTEVFTRYFKMGTLTACQHFVDVHNNTFPYTK